MNLLKERCCIQTCNGLTFLHIALPECFWFGNLLTETVWHYSQIPLTHTVDLALLLTPTTAHRALQCHTHTDAVWFHTVTIIIIFLRRMWLLCDPDLLPVVGLPLRAGLQRARLCAVGPRRGAAAVRSGTVHQPLPEAFTTAAGALRKHKKFRDLNKMFHISIRIIQDLNEADEMNNYWHWHDINYCENSWSKQFCGNGSLRKQNTENKKK